MLNQLIWKFSFDLNGQRSIVNLSADGGGGPRSNTNELDKEEEEDPDRTLNNTSLSFTNCAANSYSSIGAETDPVFKLDQHNQNSNENLIDSNLNQNINDDSANNKYENDGYFCLLNENNDSHIYIYTNTPMINEIWNIIFHSIKLLKIKRERAIKRTLVSWKNIFFSFKMLSIFSSFNDDTYTYMYICNTNLEN